MFCRVVIMRHAHSLSNEQYSITRNIPDSRVPLSPAGRLQAMQAANALGRYLARLRPEVKRLNIYHSPYLRAVETQSAVEETLSEVFNTNVSAHVDLEERKMGKFEGYKIDELRSHFGWEADAYLKDFRDREKKMYASPPSRYVADGACDDHEGESYADAIFRAQRFVQRIIMPRDDSLDIVNLIVGHGRLNSFVEKELLGLPNDYYLSIPISHNAGFKVYERRSEFFKGPVFDFDGFRNEKERVTDMCVASPVCG